MPVPEYCENSKYSTSVLAGYSFFLYFCHWVWPMKTKDMTCCCPQNKGFSTSLLWKEKTWKQKGHTQNIPTFWRQEWTKVHPPVRGVFFFILHKTQPQKNLSKIKNGNQLLFGKPSNSKLPITLPSAWVQVFPALRSTKISPGMASKTSSKGARESAQPMIAVWGAWPSWKMQATNGTAMIERKFKNMEGNQKKEVWKLFFKKKLSENGGFCTHFLVGYYIKKWPLQVQQLHHMSGTHPVLHQGLAHFLCDVASHCSIRHEARIALLQESQGFLPPRKRVELFGSQKLLMFYSSL